MNIKLLKKEISEYAAHRRSQPEKYAEMDAVRDEHAAEIGLWTEVELLRLNEEGLYRLISPLWAMLIWGNKQYVMHKLISENSLQELRTELAMLVWGEQSIAERRDKFRSRIKGMGPAMMSEVLCHIHPNSCPIGNQATAVLGYAILNYRRY